MLRTRLLTATAAVALFAAGGVFAQTAPIPAPHGGAETSTGQTVQSPAAPPAATDGAAPAETTVTTVAPETAAVQNSVVDVLRAQGQFTTLLAALDSAQLTETLGTQPAISIFAPTDAAFAALPEADRTRLMDPANVNELRQLLLYHVVVADVNSSQIEGAKGGVQTAANTEVQLDGTGDAIKVDNATVTTADIDAGNGAVFIIDRVLNPAESQVASGDAEEAAPAATEEAPAATPPVADEVEGETPPVTDDMTDDMDAPADTAPDAMAPPPTASTTTTATTPSNTTGEGYTTETAPAAPGEVRPTDSSMAPAGSPEGGVTASPSASTRTAPNGQTATTTTTVAAPPVVNPTDGQVDDEDEEDTTAPKPQS